MGKKKSEYEVLADFILEGNEDRKKKWDIFKRGMAVVDKKVPLSEEALELCDTVNRLQRFSGMIGIERQTGEEIKEILLEVARIRKRLNKLVKKGN